jgi:CheY-like chemotaxis protein
MANTKRILVADDDEGNRTALKHYFKSLGYEVDTAANYIGTRELLDTQVYALIVSDNAMPLGGESHVDRTCGLQLLAWAKSAGQNKDTPFVLHTGDDSDRTKKLVAELGGIYRYKMDSRPMNEFFNALLPK